MSSNKTGAHKRRFINVKFENQKGNKGGISKEEICKRSS